MSLLKRLTLSYFIILYLAYQYAFVDDKSITVACCLRAEYTHNQYACSYWNCVNKAMSLLIVMLLFVFAIILTFEGYLDLISLFLTKWALAEAGHTLFIVLSCLSDSLSCFQICFEDNQITRLTQKGRLKINELAENNGLYWVLCKVGFDIDLPFFRLKHVRQHT